VTSGPEEPAWVPRPAVEAFHADLIREHGGAPGLRDEALLESALARPRQLWHYGSEPDLARLAATCAFGLVRDHPVHDGNKRTGFVVLNVFLLLNGYEIEAPEPAVVDAMTRLAAGDLDEEGLAEWIRTVMVGAP